MRYGLALTLLAVMATAPHAQERAPIPWSATTPLNATDFAGRPDITSSAAAITVYRLTYQETCLGDEFSFSVVSLFLPQESWMKSNQASNLASRGRLLAHEQGHFDLSEVNARRLREALSKLERPCGMTADERRRFVVKYIQADSEAQARYDRDTSFGANESQQNRASIEIARQLAQLAAYADDSGGSITPSGSAR